MRHNQANMNADTRGGHSCLFCGILAKEVSAEIFYEDGCAIAFLDIHPRTPGHAMVIPRRHVQTLADVRAEEVGPLFCAVQAAAQAVRSALGADGMTIGINDGRASGQVVNHLHVHLMPRFEGDGGGSVHAAVNNPPKESLAEIGSKIRNQAKK